MVKKLLILNGIAILGAVLNHATGWGFTSLFWWTDRYLNVMVPDFGQMYSPAYWGLRFVEQVIIFAVPSFLFVSGFFVSFAVGRSSKGLNWRLVLERVRKLSIPYLIWSIIIIGLRVFQGQRYEFRQIFESIFFGLTEPPYYFVPVLIQLYLLSPLIVILAKQKPLLLFITALLVNLTVSTLRYTAILDIHSQFLDYFSFFTKSWFFPGFVLWFVSGVLFGLYLPQIKDRLIRFRWLAFVSAIIFLVIGIIEWEVLLIYSGQTWVGTTETLVDNLYAFAFIGSFLGFQGFTPPFSKQFAMWGERSFGIYLIHSPALEYTSRAIYHLIPGLLRYQLLMQPVIIFVGLGFPLILMAIIDRSPFLRSYYNYLFG